MNITEVRVKLLGGRSDRLRAFCSVTLDDEFVVHDLRVIDGRKGLFVAMPSRKLSDNCPQCGGKNHLRARYCTDCGNKLNENRASERDKYHVDVAHPIVSSCREQVQATVLEAYEEEIQARKSSGELSGDAEGDYDDDYYDDFEEEPAEEEQEKQRRQEQQEEPLPVASFGASGDEDEDDEQDEPFPGEFQEQLDAEPAGAVREEPAQYDSGDSDEEDEHEEPEADERQDQKGESSNGFGDGIL